MKRLGLFLVLFASFALAVCTDSDGGRIYPVQGTCTDAFKSFTDSCVSAEQLKEYYCTGTTLGECRPVIQICGDYLAGSSCVDGACVLPAAPQAGEATPSPTVEAHPSPTPQAEVYAGTPTEEKPAAVQALPFWLAAALLAIGFVMVYHYSVDRMESRREKKGAKRK